jgi:hypothetical protein
VWSDLKHRISSFINTKTENHVLSSYSIVDRSALGDWEITIPENNHTHTETLSFSNYSVKNLPRPYWHEYFQVANESFTPFFYYEVKDAEIVGQSGITTSPPNFIHLENSVFQTEFFKRTNDVRKIPIRKFLPGQKITGPAVVLSNYFHTNYFHWITETLPRVLNLKKAFSKPLTFILSENPPSFQFETLKLLLGNDDKILEQTSQVLQVENLIIPSFLHKRSDKFSNINLYRSDVLAKLSDVILNEISLEESESTTPEILFISRKNAKKRPFKEEYIIENQLKGQSYEIIEASDYSFQEQVRLYHQAKVIIAPHGAGLTNTLFCKPGTKIIELFPPDKYIRDATFYYQTSKAVGLEHYLVNLDKFELFDFKNISENRIK